MDEITTNINVSGIPVEWIPEINKVSDNFSKAVRTLIREALDARKSSDASMTSKYGLTPAQAEEFLKKLPALIRAERQAKEEKIKESKQ